MKQEFEELEKEAAEALRDLAALLLAARESANLRQRDLKPKGSGHLSKIENGGCLPGYDILRLYIDKAGADQAAVMSAYKRADKLQEKLTAARKANRRKNAIHRSSPVAITASIGSAASGDIESTADSPIDLRCDIVVTEIHVFCIMDEYYRLKRVDTLLRLRALEPSAQYFRFDGLPLPGVTTCGYWEGVPSRLSRPPYLSTKWESVDLSTLWARVRPTQLESDPNVYILKHEPLTRRPKPLRSNEQLTALARTRIRRKYQPNVPALGWIADSYLARYVIELRFTRGIAPDVVPFRQGPSDAGSSPGSLPGESGPERVKRRLSTYRLGFTYRYEFYDLAPGEHCGLRWFTS